MCMCELYHSEATDNADHESQHGGESKSGLFRRRRRDQRPPVHHQYLAARYILLVFRSQ